MEGERTACTGGGLAVGVSASHGILFVFHRIRASHVGRLNALARRMPVACVSAKSQMEDATLAHAMEARAFALHFATASEPTLRGNLKALGEMRTCMAGDLSADLVALGGWMSPYTIAALIWAKIQGRRTVLLCETSAKTANDGRAARLYKAFLARMFDGAVATGSPQRRYLEGYGLSGDRVVLGCNVVDVTHFDPGRRGASGPSSPTWAETLPARYFVVSARLVALKYVDRILDAFDAFKHTSGSAFHLVIVGDGPEKERLEQRAHGLSSRRAIHFLGFVGYDDLPTVYGGADALVLASRTEAWGMVVNEAMAAGCAALVSRNCGCSDDLVIDGETGFLLADNATETIAEAMRRYDALSEDSKSAMQRNAHTLIQQWGLARFVQSFETMALSATRKHGRGVGAFLALGLLPLFLIAAHRRSKTTEIDL